MNAFKFECPVCGQHLSATADQVGQEGPCPGCETLVTIPPAPFVPSTSTEVSTTASTSAPPPLTPPPPPLVYPSDRPSMGDGQAPPESTQLGCWRIFLRIIGVPALFIGGISVWDTFRRLEQSLQFGSSAGFAAGYYVGLFLFPILFVIAGIYLIASRGKNQSISTGSIVLFILTGAAILTWELLISPQIEADQKAYAATRAKQAAEQAPTPGTRSVNQAFPVDRIATGTSAAQVRDRWGPPSRIEVIKESTPRSERWSYTFGEVLILEDGIVTEVTDPFRQ